MWFLLLWQTLGQNRGLTFPERMAEELRRFDPEELELAYCIPYVKAEGGVTLPAVIAANKLREIPGDGK